MGIPLWQIFNRGTVSKILNKSDVRPHKITYYLEKRDPDFESKMTQVLHVYKIDRENLSVKVAKDHIRIQDEGRKLLLDSGGKIHVLPKAEMERVGKAIKPVWKDWISEGEAKKGLPRKKMLKDLYGILKDLGVQKPYLGS